MPHAVRSSSLDVDRPAVVVLHTLRDRRDGTTYVHHMRDAAAPEVTVRLFSWRAALLQDYDVLHIHWPEHLVCRRHPAKAVSAAVGFVLLMLRLARRGTPLVRTLHNVAPHQATPVLLRRLLTWAEARTDAFVHLNPLTPQRSGAMAVTIPHGHYRDRFAALPVADRVPGRLLYIGHIEPYKGVDVLLEQVRRWPRGDVSLRVVGAPRGAQISRSVQAACAEDPRITSTLRFVSDSELVQEVTRAQVVVLPYREMHNSGMVLVALSLDRPVLVPRTPTNGALSAEVGPGWVLMYDGELDQTDLARAVESTEAPPVTRPRLAGRDWDAVGEQHYQLYLAVLGRRRRAQPAATGELGGWSGARRGAAHRARRGPA